MFFTTPSEVCEILSFTRQSRKDRNNGRITTMSTYSSNSLVLSVRPGLQFLRASRLSAAGRTEQEGVWCAGVVGACKSCHVVTRPANCAAHPDETLSHVLHKILLLYKSCYHQPHKLTTSNIASVL
jgi:hypothetical protein